MGCGADILVVLRPGQLQLLEEDAVRLIGMMLAGVKDEKVERSFLALPDDGSHLKRGM
jgi:hypothetical protein